MVIGPTVFNIGTIFWIATMEKCNKTFYHGNLLPFHGNYKGRHLAEGHLADRHFADPVKRDKQNGVE